MDGIVTQYLPQAFAFIYVINSANSGGVQKDRVSNIAIDAAQPHLSFTCKHIVYSLPSANM